MKALRLFPILFLIAFAGFAQVKLGIYPLAIASGTDTYTATVSPAPDAYESGQRFNIKFTNANTGASTININSKGAVSLVKEGGTALSANDIKAGEIKLLVYDGTNMQIVGGSGGLETIETTGTNNLTATVEGITAYEDEKPYLVFHDGSNNTAGVTLDINSLGAKAVHKADGGTVLSAGEWRAHTLYLLVYHAAMDFGNGGFRISGTGTNYNKFLLKTGETLTSGFNLLQNGLDQTSEIVTSNGTGFIVNNKADNKSDLTLAAYNYVGEPAGFLGDLDNTGGLGRGFYFIDLRGTPKGLQYHGVGYENSGNDSTLISKGWSNSTYWKNSGTTQTSGDLTVDGDFSNTLTFEFFSNINFSSDNYLFDGGGTLDINASTVRINNQSIQVLHGSAVLDFPSVPGPGTVDLTMTVTGAAPGDPVTVSAPHGSMTFATIYFGWVSALDTVTIRFAVVGNSPGTDPASGTFNVTVYKP